MLVNGRVHASLDGIAARSWHVLRLVNAGGAAFLHVTEDLPTSSSSPRCALRLLAQDGHRLVGDAPSLTRVVIPPGGRADVALFCVASARFVSAAHAQASTILGNAFAYEGPLFGVNVVGGDGSSSTTTPSQAERNSLPASLTAASAEAWVARAAAAASGGALAFDRQTIFATADMTINGQRYDSQVRYAGS